MWVGHAVNESKVTVVISALNELENDIDSLYTQVSDMKRQMSIRVQKEIDALYEGTRKAATEEAKTIIDKSRKAATEEAARISKEAESRLEKTRADINSGFDSAVQSVVSMVLNH